MAEESDRNVALLSIHPRHADAILSGSKKVELRKRPFAERFDRVVIYATAPISAVVGAFRVDEVETATPATLWRKYHMVSGVTESEFKRYYGDGRLAVAIHVRDPIRFPHPMRLREAVRVSKPPQSFRYLRDQDIRFPWPDAGGLSKRAVAMKRKTRPKRGR